MKCTKKSKQNASHRKQQLWKDFQNALQLNKMRCT